MLLTPPGFSFLFLPALLFIFSQYFFILVFTFQPFSFFLKIYFSVFLILFSIGWACLGERYFKKK